jgi:hypothetical protein
LYAKRRRRGFGYGRLRRIKQTHDRRSNRARCIDEGLGAPIAKTPEQWIQQSNRYDIPDVGTPKSKEAKAERRARFC